MDALHLDLYPLSWRWLRAGVELEAGRGRGTILGRGSSVSYGMMGVKRMDLEVGTNERGLARIEGLPTKARLLIYDIQKAGMKATVEQNLAASCFAKFESILK